MFVTCKIRIDALNGKSSYAGEPKFLAIKSTTFTDNVIVETPDGESFEIVAAELIKAIKAASV